MGQHCCAGESDPRVRDPPTTVTRDIDPTKSLLNTIKFPSARKPDQHPVVRELNIQAGNFKTQSHSNISGQASDPKKLNSEGLVYSG